MSGWPRVLQVTLHTVGAGVRLFLFDAGVRHPHLLVHLSASTAFYDKHQEQIRGSAYAFSPTAIEKWHNIIDERNKMLEFQFGQST